MKRRRIILAGGTVLALPAFARAACMSTRADQLGPYFVPNAPRESDLCAAAGNDERLSVSGRIAGVDCQPLAGVTIEVWQANAKGEYSQVSRERKDDPHCLLRATLTSGADGRYGFRSVLPGAYPGRPRHIHFRVGKAGYRTLVTQLYFERESGVDEGRVAKLMRGPASGDKPADYQAVFDITILPA